MDAKEFATLEAAEATNLCFGLVASLIGEEPQAQQVQAFIDNEIFSEAPMAQDNPNVATGLRKLQEWCAGYAQLGGNEAAEYLGTLRRDWFALFVGTGVPGSPCWATYYSDPNKQLIGKETLAVRAAYAKLGLRLEKTNAEPDDHLMYMLRFLGYAMLQEAQAAAAGNAEQAQALFDLQADFAIAHVLPWITRWAYVADREAKTPFCSGTAFLTFGFVEEYAKRFGVVFKEDTRTFVRKRA